MATTYHLVHYRKFEMGEGGPSQSTLERLCRRALDETDDTSYPLWDRVASRLFDLKDEGGRQVLLNKVADLSSAVFGELCLVHNTDTQALLSLVPQRVQLSNLTQAEIFDLGERGAPTGSKFVRGLLYLLAIGDHLFFIKTQGMSSELLQRYLQWLLSRGAALEPGVGSVPSFQLRAELDRSRVAGDIGEIRALRVSGQSAPHLAVAPTGERSSEVRTRRKVLDRLVEFGKAIPVATALLGADKTESLVASLGPEEYLAVEAQVSVRGKRTAASRERMIQVVNDLADMTDAHVRVEGRDGVLSDGDAILRTRMPFEVPYEGSSLLEFDNVADQLQTVYNRFVKDGKIAA